MKKGPGRPKKEESKIVNETHNHHHHDHHNWGKCIELLFYWLLALILLTTVLGWVTYTLIEDQTVHSNCVDACSKKGFLGTELGLDGDLGCKVNEYDRTECVKSCNNMYLQNQVKS